ncbi:uncharacterized protein BDR25DRAFT_355448 [Lindgomyces ingoldianus]|uniref:Uncharacterized protein n=1 Tax=Lindgomyces ingoldianus TaxID=673940 RepID=A0ACB6QUR8_9PLEO|nr:uncharacterized protein BDR25DRAFT_355448 [Lindgomyces ingoldianus]KAF2470333.1 hypothetical protein BDR25DRAFT_355448 [Lindgomyces ingoldianus]
MEKWVSLVVSLHQLLAVGPSVRAWDHYREDQNERQAIAVCKPCKFNPKIENIEAGGNYRLYYIKRVGVVLRNNGDGTARKRARIYQKILTHVVALPDVSKMKGILPAGRWLAKTPSLETFRLKPRPKDYHRRMHRSKVGTTNTGPHESHLEHSIKANPLYTCCSLGSESSTFQGEVEKEKDPNYSLDEMNIGVRGSDVRFRDTGSYTHLISSRPPSCKPIFDIRAIHMTRGQYPAHTESSQAFNRPHVCRLQITCIFKRIRLSLKKLQAPFKLGTSTPHPQLKIELRYGLNARATKTVQRGPPCVEHTDVKLLSITPFRTRGLTTTSQAAALVIPADITVCSVRLKSDNSETAFFYEHASLRTIILAFPRIYAPFNFCSCRYFGKGMRMTHMYMQGLSFWKIGCDDGLKGCTKEINIRRGGNNSVPGIVVDPIALLSTYQIDCVDYRLRLRLEWDGHTVMASSQLDEVLASSHMAALIDYRCIDPRVWLLEPRHRRRFPIQQNLDATRLNTVGIFNHDFVDFDIGWGLESDPPHRESFDGIDEQLSAEAIPRRWRLTNDILCNKESLTCTMRAGKVLVPYFDVEFAGKWIYFGVEDDASADVHMGPNVIAGVSHISIWRRAYLLIRWYVEAVIGEKQRGDDISYQDGKEAQGNTGSKRPIIRTKTRDVTQVSEQKIHDSFAVATTRPPIHTLTRVFNLIGNDFDIHGAGCVHETKRGEEGLLIAVRWLSRLSIDRSDVGRPSLVVVSMGLGSVNVGFRFRMPSHTAPSDEAQLSHTSLLFSPVKTPQHHRDNTARVYRGDLLPRDECSASRWAPLRPWWKGGAPATGTTSILPEAFSAPLSSTVLYLDMTSCITRLTAAQPSLSRLWMPIRTTLASPPNMHRSFKSLNAGRRTCFQFKIDERALRVPVGQGSVPASWWIGDPALTRLFIRLPRNIAAPGEVDVPVWGSANWTRTNHDRPRTDRLRIAISFPASLGCEKRLPSTTVRKAFVVAAASKPASTFCGLYRSRILTIRKRPEDGIVPESGVVPLPCYSRVTCENHGDLSGSPSFHLRPSENERVFGPPPLRYPAPRQNVLTARAHAQQPSFGTYAGFQMKQLVFDKILWYWEQLVTLAPDVFQIVLSLATALPLLHHQFMPVLHKSKPICHDTDSKPTPAYGDPNQYQPEFRDSALTTTIFPPAELTVWPAPSNNSQSSLLGGSPGFCTPSILGMMDAPTRKRNNRSSTPFLTSGTDQASTKAGTRPPTNIEGSPIPQDSFQFQLQSSLSAPSHISIDNPSTSHRHLNRGPHPLSRSRLPKTKTLVDHLFVASLQPAGYEPSPQSSHPTALSIFSVVTI